MQQPTPPLLSAPKIDRKSARWQLIRDVSVFQLKLLVDGLRDLVFGPLSLVAAIIGLLSGDDNPRQLYDRILRFGERFDLWVDLFGTRQQAPNDGGQTAENASIDFYVQRLEEILRQQHDRGGITKSAKERIDSILDAAQFGKRPGPPSQAT